MFFDSELVKKELEEISNLQEKIYKNVFSFFSMGKDEKIRHIDLLKKLIEKQKILYTRISLSDDPQAKEIKERIINSASMMGIPQNVDINILFNDMTKMIDKIKSGLDKME